MSPSRLFANVIGGALIGGFLGAMFTLFIIPIPAPNEQIIVYMIGQLSGFAGGIISYYFASKAHDTRAQELEAERSANLSKTVDLARAALEATPGERPKGTADDPIAVEEVK